mmetsp:Transcript_27996/g.61272  ORF Transcript_27996/g.61272 Transcript_27996/m.61272 type:complete len:969 (-) Transcript_27996:262-3168(-)|eukprot:CAMPEP_0118933630 /NCGR_PEP_ID=MMETSP1169-20130426/12095_1 /TAXON_ID=36882 /ORGANISM="Pyramimonas obovata, Strain CCMP722" /LENGTH=968 /DNA_ID=CAMNT_0006876417 /DNA_START=205 /DNA_END=3111 /DNA_ORIENTATION=-
MVTTSVAPTGLVQKAEALLFQPGGQLNALQEAEAAIDTLQPLLTDESGGDIDVSKLPEGTEVVNLLYRALMTAGDANLRLGRTKDALVQFEQCKALVPTSVAACAGYAKSLCGEDRIEEATELLLSLEKGAQNNTVDELTLLGSAWLYTDDRQKAKKVLRSAWSRGGNPFEYALSFVDHYSNQRTNEMVGEHVDGYVESMKFLRECGRGGGNARDPRFRYQLVLMLEEDHFHQVCFQSTKMARESDLAGNVLEGLMPQSGDPMTVLHSCRKKTRGADHGKYWSHYAIHEAINRIYQKHLDEVNQTCGHMTEAEKKFVALTHAAKEDSDPEKAQVTNRLYQYLAREAFDDGSVTTGPHLLFDKCIANALTEWLELNTQHPNIPDVLMHMARTQMQTGRLQQAREAAAAAMTQDGGALSTIFNAALQNPVKLTNDTMCPPPMLAHTEDMIKVVELMEERGPIMCDYELWDLYSEEICHVSNSLLVRVAVLVMRGNNAAKKHRPVERLGSILAHLIPECIESLGEASIVAIELRHLYQFVAYEQLVALDAINQDNIATNPANITAAHKAVGTYERLFTQLVDDLKHCEKVPPGAPELLIKVAELGVSLRPKCSLYHRKHAEAVELVADHCGLPAAQKTASYKRAAECLRASFTFEGLPTWDDPRFWKAAAGPAAEAGVTSPRDDEKAPRQMRKSAHDAEDATDIKRTAQIRRKSMLEGGKRTSFSEKDPQHKPVRRSVMVVPGAHIKKEVSSTQVRPAITECLFEEDTPIATKNEKNIKARIDLARLLTLADSHDPEVVAECKALYEEVLKSESRNADVWVAFAKVQLESGNVMDAVNSLAKYPAPVDPAYPSEDDGVVHVEVVKYMMMLAGIDMEGDNKGVTPLETVIQDPTLQHSVVLVARSPLGWPAVDRVVTIISDAGQKGLCKSIYLDAMEDSGVSDDELTKYMKTRGWVAKFASVNPTFTALDQD